MSTPWRRWWSRRWAQSPRLDGAGGRGGQPSRLGGLQVPSTVRNPGANSPLQTKENDELTRICDDLISKMKRI